MRRQATQTRDKYWLFGDELEHLVDPRKVIKRIRSVLPAGGSVAKCLPNMQH
jgi:hypothetical protein